MLLHLVLFAKFMAGTKKWQNVLVKDQIPSQILFPSPPSAAEGVGNLIPDFMCPRCTQVMISKQNNYPSTYPLRKIIIHQNKEKSVGGLDFELMVRMSHKCRMVGRPCGQFQG